ncbi:SMI1/KNR4 family protein [Paenibacillus sp. IHBB 10380]|uniref:SMI1/KNR4 family protein n=1 Tax=Paenibacillus sp. IHBB 10380 TaxID=1566358 RepID=UPI0005CFDB3A|nr:SMI1/KNR4 family protein [Paenibacillus sp. IHBB 10380]AJS61243.1 hypothetical protein UB51_25570 [Paenibacillus sp. IHBB 10380]
MHQRMEIWGQQWDILISKLDQKGADTHLTLDPPASEAELTEAESRLGVRLPNELRTLLGQGSAKALVYWNLPDGIIIPFEVSGDVGWDIQSLDFPDFADDNMIQQQRYMTFHLAGNGDELLLDLEDGSGQPAVVHWAHEMGEFLRLAPSLGEFIDRITELGCVGAEEWQYPPFCDEEGLNPVGTNAMKWKHWLHQYTSLTLDKVRTELLSLISYTTMNGIDADVVASFASFDPDDVLQAWLARIQAEPERNVRQSLMRYVGQSMGPYAAEWVRTLWSDPATDGSIPQVQAYLAALCLPEEEGLQLVWNHLDSESKGTKLSGYLANSMLSPFHSRHVIAWMETRVSFPYGGWETLFAQSCPVTEDVIRWLNGKDVQRQVVISALSKLPDETELLASELDRRSMLELLKQALDQAVLKKEKQLVQEAISRFERG